LSSFRLSPECGSLLSLRFELLFFFFPYGRKGFRPLKVRSFFVFSRPLHFVFSQFFSFEEKAVWIPFYSHFSFFSLLEQCPFLVHRSHCFVSNRSLRKLSDDCRGKMCPPFTSFYLFFDLWFRFCNRSTSRIFQFSFPTGVWGARFRAPEVLLASPLFFP